MDTNITTSPAIKKLPIDVQALIRSGVIITNASQCVTELVLNALDARATKIAVRINFNYHKIQIADNGCGMSGDELNLIGERFMTSKCHSLNDLEGNLSHYGFRGEALASLKECSGLLSLESRPEDSETTYAKVYAHGKTHSSGISKNSRPACGTTVTVHDFMYNMPVRRGRMQPNFEVEEIKSCLESIALIHPEVSFSLHNEVNSQLIMQTHKSSGIVGAFSQLFSKTLARSLVPVNYSMGHYCVNGYIGKETHNRKNLQFIYVNKRLVLKTKLHKIANTVLGMSFLLRQNAPSREVPACKDYTTEQWLFFSPPDRDRYATYIFNIICPHRDYDICLDPKKTLIEFKDWNSVLQCLENAINVFLQKECNTFNTQEKRNVQSKIQDRSLLHEISQLDKEYALGKYGKISQESKEPDLTQQTGSREDNFSIKKTEKFLPGIHNIFGAVCGAQAIRKTLIQKAVINDTNPSKNIRKHKLEEKHQDTSESTFVLLQKSNITEGKLVTHKEKRDELESSISSSFPKAFILDSSKKKPLTCERRSSYTADPLKLRNTAINVIKPSNTAEINVNISTSEQVKYTDDNISSTCPIVKFRKMYGNSENSIKEDKVIPNVQYKRKLTAKKHFQEEASFGHTIEQNFSKHNITADSESKYISKHISTKTIAVQNSDSSISGISEVPIIEAEMKCFSNNVVVERKAAIHPIQRFRLSVGKKCSHKLQSTNCRSPLEKNKHLVPEKLTITDVSTECKIHKPKSKQSLWQNISATKTSMSICNVNFDKAYGSNRQEHKKCIPGNLKSFIEGTCNQTSVVSKGKSWAAELHQQDGIYQLSNNPLFERPMQLNKVKCGENATLEHCQSPKKLHSNCPCNKNIKKWQTLDHRISINTRSTEHNSALMPLWSLNYVNKRKSDLQMSPNKRKVHFLENPLFINGFKDYNSRIALADADRKYITSSDFLHTIYIKELKDPLLKDQSISNFKKVENSNENMSLLFDTKMAYNFMKHLPENWRLKAENQTINIANTKECPVNQSLSFIFSPKQVIYAQPLTIKEIFPNIEYTLKDNNNKSTVENIEVPLSIDIMKQYRNIITLSSGSEADVDTTISLNTCGATFLTHMAHPSSEREVSVTYKMLNQNHKQQILEQINASDDNKIKYINFGNDKIVAESVVTAETNKVSHPHASRNTSPLYQNKTNISPEATPTVACNVEENNTCTLIIHSEDSHSGSENELKDSSIAFPKSADNASVESFITAQSGDSSSADCQELYDRLFSDKTCNSPYMDISLLLSQRVLENFSKDQDINSSLMQITSNYISPIMPDLSDSSDISFIHERSMGHSKNLIIKETSSSEIIDVTPEAKIHSKKLSLFERCNTKNTIGNIQRHQPISDPDKQTEKENGTIESDKCESAIVCDKTKDKICKEVILTTNDEQSSASKYSDQERKRSSDDDLSDLYGKRLSLEKTMSGNSVGNILSGCTEILNEAFDKFTNNVLSNNQERAKNTSTLTDEIQTNINEQLKRMDECKQKQELGNNEFKLSKSDKELQSKTNSTTSNNVQHNNCDTTDVSNTQGAEKELVSNIVPEASSKIVLQDVRENNNERENVYSFDVYDNTNNEPLCLEEWEKRIDCTGRQFYIHKESGMSSFHVPDSKSAGASYAMSERYGFLPKGLSPILKGNCNNLSKEQDVLTPNTRHAFHDALIQDHTDALDKLKQIKWRQFEDLKDSGCRDLLKTFVEDSEFSMQFCEKEVPRTNTKDLPKCYSTMFSYTFTKETFSKLKILGQLDRKFIVVITMCEENKRPRYIVLFDQHAVHERIRVEQLMQEYQEEESNTKFKTSVLDSAVILSLGKDDIRILQSFRNGFENLGIRFELLDDSTVQVSSVPTCLLMREIREGKKHGPSILKTLLESLIREQIDCLVATRGSAARVPKTLQAVINSEACRGALKFGDELTTEECRVLLSSLSSCKLPFHCAHGRPALTSVADLENVYIHQKPVYKPPDLKKLKKLFAE